MTTDLDTLTAALLAVKPTPTVTDVFRFGQALGIKTSDLMGPLQEQMDVKTD